MPEYPIRDSIISSLNAQEPWPENVKLFQPYEVEQILLPDNASCLAVQAFLKMCNLPFEVEMRWNAEFMSPSGRVPFIKCGAFVVSELEPIAQFAANKGVSLCSKLSSEEKAEMRAYMSLITNVLVNAELYISWLDNETFNQVTRVRHSSVYPWPLGWLQTRTKRNQVAKRLKALSWHDRTIDQVLADVEQCCNSLSQRLGEKDFFFGTVTPLDALVYGHIRALLSAKGPKAPLMIKPITNALLKHVVRITTLVGMKLAPQEEYLVKQALLPRSHMSMSATRSERTRRSKLSVRNLSRDNLNVFGIKGFKPFASKQIVVMQTREGSMTCIYNDKHYNYLCLDEAEYNIILEIIDDIFDKVEELISDEQTNKQDSDTERTDFEVLAFPNQVTKTESVEKFDDTLENIHDDDDNNVLEDSTLSLDVSDNIEDVIQIINDIDSNKRLSEVCEGEEFEPNVDCDKDNVTTVDDCAEGDLIFPYSPVMTDSSNNEYINDEYLTKLASSGDQISAKVLSKSSSSVKPSEFSPELISTLKMRCDSELIVDSLLDFLLNTNASHDPLSVEMADID